MVLVVIEVGKAFTTILSNVPLLRYLMVAFRRQIFPLRPFFLRIVQYTFLIHSTSMVLALLLGYERSDRLYSKEVSCASFSVCEIKMTLLVMMASRSPLA